MRRIYRQNTDIFEKFAFTQLIEIFIGYECSFPIQQSPQLDPIFTQLIPATSSHSISLLFILIIPSTLMPGSRKWSLQYRFQIKILHAFNHLSHACYIPCPSHPPQFDLHNNIEGREYLIKHMFTFLMFTSQPSYKPT